MREVIKMIGVKKQHEAPEQYFVYREYACSDKNHFRPEGKGFKVMQKETGI